MVTFMLTLIFLINVRECRSRGLWFALQCVAEYKCGLFTFSALGAGEPGHASRELLKARDVCSNFTA